MKDEIHIKEINPINVENGVIINGFPSSGITSAIATESMINTSNFESVSYTHLTLPTILLV